MRRTLAAGMVALSLALATTPTLVSAADGARPRPSTSAADHSRIPASSAHERATAALQRAKALFAPSPGGQRPAQGARGLAHGDATFVMRDLFKALDDLTPSQRREARAILARPTDGPRNDQNGYRTSSVKQCGGHFCVHWVKSTNDAPPSRAWALKMLKLMNRVWNREVGGLGYRRPISDNGRGGNDKFDVYLAQLGDQKLYGYCTTERTKPGFRYLASGYCVLDNDFRDSVFAGSTPMGAAKVTAAHEFFHAIQFAYDYLEDVWLMEATATWMEERVFDGINDNRQYLLASQLSKPDYPLDYYDVGSASVYGNWVFFEFLSKTFGNKAVRYIWNNAGAFAGARDMYSTQAIVQVLKSRGGFTKAYAKFSGANVLPATSYSEGDTWPSAELAAAPITLTSASPTTGEQSDELLHMSSQTWRVDTSASLTGLQYQLKVDIDGPASFRMPAGYVQVVGDDGSVKRYYVRLNTSGVGSVTVPFDSTYVQSVYVTLVNASTRFRCYKSYVYSCQGLPIDDGSSFLGQHYAFTASVVES